MAMAQIKRCQRLTDRDETDAYFIVRDTNGQKLKSEWVPDKIQAPADFRQSLCALRWLMSMASRVQ
jgi:hypothetical protein